MLKFRKLDYRPWPVSVSLMECDEETGQVAEAKQSFINHFAPFDEEQLLKARLDVFGDESDTENKKRLGDLPIVEYAVLESRFFAALTRNWSKLQDEGGGPVPYSAETLRALCTGPDGVAFRRGYNQAINEIRFGVAPAKNAETSPSPGPAPAPGEVASPS